MVYNEIVSYIETMARRSDLTRALIDQFIAVAHARIIRDTKLRRLILQIKFTPAGSPWFLPSDFDSVVQITAPVAGGVVKVPRISRAQLVEYSNADSPNTWGYVLNGSTISVAPATNKELTMIYQSDPGTITQGSNAITNFYPYLYIYGALVEVYTWTRDDNERQKALDNYNAEVSLLNSTEAEKNAGDAPQSSGASSWV